MKGLNDLLQLGHPLLYEVCDTVTQDDLDSVQDWVNDLHNVMHEIRLKYNFGRAIAAPQLGIMKRLVYMNIDAPVVFINPIIIDKSEELFEVWDDCMCFPNLLVKVMRHKTITISYRDEKWIEKKWHLKDDLAELLQHELDHLDGVLCTMRAIDDRSFRWRK